MKRLGLLVVLFALLMVSQAYAYSYSAGALYCNSCTDCTDAINNVTFNTTYLNTSISTTDDCIYSPENFNNVIFDCQGYTITGGGETAGWDDAFYLSGDTNNTIRNCTITDFERAVYLGSSSHNNTITNNTFTDHIATTSATIHVSSSESNNITNNTISSNAGHGVYLSSSEYNNITNNTISSNGNLGIYVSSSDDNRIENNTLVSNTGHAIHLYYSANATIIANTITGHSQSLAIRSSSLADYTHNITTSNTIDGKIVYYYVNQENITLNTSSNAGFVGLISCNNTTVRDINVSNNYNNILVVNSANTFIINNTVTSSGDNGIDISLSSVNTTISNNSISSSGADGIDSVGNITLINNTISDSGDNGIKFTGDSSIIRDNIFINNNDRGILVSSADSSNVTNNTITSNPSSTAYGIMITGELNNVSNNTINTNKYGIYISGDSNNVTSNNITSDRGFGIQIISAKDNTLVDNTIAGHAYNFYLTASTLADYKNNITTSNTIDGKIVYYYINQQDITLDTSSNAGFVALISCDNITVRDSTLINNSHGLLIMNTTDVTIINNTISSNNQQGIFMDLWTNDTIIQNNNITSNGARGIRLRVGSNSTITDNIVTSNANGGISIDLNSTVADNILSGNAYGIEIWDDNNNVTNNTMSPISYSGISLSGAINNNITYNTVSSSGFRGMNIYSSSDNNNIINNTISSTTSHGMRISSSDNIFIINNTISSSDAEGIYLTGAINCTLSGNTITNSSTYNFGMYGISPLYYNHSVDTTNTVNGNPIYYYHNQNDVTLSPTPTPGFMGCFNCTNVIFGNASISNNFQGLLFASTNNSTAINYTLGTHWWSVHFDKASNNNVIMDSFIYYADAYTINNEGNNNTFINTSFMYDIIAPVLNTWYDSFDEMFFKISKMPNDNVACSLYVDDTVVRTNNSVEANQVTNFTYSPSEGSHTYYFYCIDVGASTTETQTVSTAFGIKFSKDVAGCTLSSQCVAGYCVHGTCREAETYCGDGYCDYGESYSSCSNDCTETGGSTGFPSTGTDTEDSSVTDPTTVSSTIDDWTTGQSTIPPGGLGLLLDEKTTLNLFGTQANIRDIYTINPNDFKSIMCNQTELSSYEISVDVDDSAYVCFDYTEHTDLQGITIFTIREGEWAELSDIVIKDEKVCGRITSSPYMIAGFNIPITANIALEKIQFAQEGIQDDDTQAIILLDQARDAYYNCDYDESIKLAEAAARASGTQMTGDEIFYLIIIGAFVALGAGLYIYRKKITI